MIEDAIAAILWFVIRVIFWPVFVLARVWFEISILVLDSRIGERWAKPRLETNEPAIASRIARFVVGLILYFATMLVIALVLTVAFWMGWLPWWVVFGLVIATAFLFLTATVLSTFGLMIGGKADPRLNAPTPTPPTPAVAPEPAMPSEVRSFC